MMSLRWVTLSLIAAVLVSCLAVIRSTHASRAYYADLQRIEGTHWYLQEDYSRLMLERSTLASPHRIAKLARDELVMKIPDLASHRTIIEGEY
ncbi:MAG: cell division protein FtsL [Luminiphilus sp.]|jgi:cell division protein FtsL|nr:cell division protein FtsL [Luminiphilus sp.]